MKKFEEIRAIIRSVLSSPLGPSIEDLAQRALDLEQQKKIILAFKSRGTEETKEYLQVHSMDHAIIFFALLVISLIVYFSCFE